MPVRAAFSADDPPFGNTPCRSPHPTHRAGRLYLADLWYYPDGPLPKLEPLILDLQAREIGYYHVPTYMADQSGDLVFQVPCVP